MGYKGTVITRKRLDVSNARRMQISIGAVINSVSVRRYDGPGTIKYSTAFWMQFTIPTKVTVASQSRDILPQIIEDIQRSLSR